MRKISKRNVWNSLISIFSIAAFIWAINSYNKSAKDRENILKDNYINDCIQELNVFNYSDEQKEKACFCRYEYLFSKYRKDIYLENFIIPTREDSLFVIDCLLKESKLQNISSDSLLNLLNE
ncbi:MAG: hypothetical protein HQ521_12050 [Bacteroidetes bacterium]|nr:hypothetical protein [Bacteroidota bacterium]